MNHRHSHSASKNSTPSNSTHGSPHQANTVAAATHASSWKAPAPPRTRIRETACLTRAALQCTASMRSSCPTAPVTSRYSSPSTTRPPKTTSAPGCTAWPTISLLARRLLLNRTQHPRRRPRPHLLKPKFRRPNISMIFHLPSMATNTPRYLVARLPDWKRSWLQTGLASTRTAKSKSHCNSTCVIGGN